MTSQRRTPVTRGQRILNRIIAWLSDRGVGVAGARSLVIVGRRSGEPRRVVVNPLDHDGARYLVAPRGETDWVSNARAAGRGELRHGRHGDEVRLVEVPTAQRPPILRDYLDRWGWEVGALLPDGVAVDMAERELGAVAHLLPVFRLDDVRSSASPQ